MIVLVVVALLLARSGLLMPECGRVLSLLGFFDRFTVCEFIGKWRRFHGTVLWCGKEILMENTQNVTMNLALVAGDDEATRLDHPLEFEQFCSFIQEYVRENDMVLTEDMCQTHFDLP